MLIQLALSEYDSVAMALSQLEDWQTAAVPLVTLMESLPYHRVDVVEAFLSSTEHGIFSSAIETKHMLKVEFPITLQ